MGDQDIAPALLPIQHVLEKFFGNAFERVVK